MRTTRRLVPAAIIALAIFAVAGCSDDDDDNGGGPSANSTITIVPAASNKGMMAFDPPIDTVQVGQTVRMHNGDTVNHVIQPVSGNFPSWGSIPAGTGVTITANTAGTFDYFCTIASHTMTGRLVVQ